MPETKSFCTYEQQLQILKRRGLSIADDALALQWLREKNYYRLSAYSLTLRHKSPSTGEDEFLKDSSFSTIIDLYQFDEQFRAAISHAAAIAETNLKAYIATMPANTVRSAIWMEIILKIPGGTLNF